MPMGQCFQPPSILGLQSPVLLVLSWPVLKAANPLLWICWTRTSFCDG